MRISCGGTPAGRVLYLELGVGYNTPVIIKYPFWQRTAANPDAVYACVNLEGAVVPADIAGRSIGVQADLAGVIAALCGEKERRLDRLLFPCYHGGDNAPPAPGRQEGDGFA